MDNVFDNPIAIQLFEHSTLLQSWNAEDKHRVKEHAKTFSWDTGQLLFSRGDPARWLYIVISGSVKGVVFSEDGHEAIIDLAGPGQWFGGLSIIDQQPHPQTAVALEPTLCLALDGLIIREVLEANPSLYRDVVFMLCQRLRSTFSWIEDSLLGSVQDRIFKRLQDIALSIGERHEDGFIIQSRLSQDALASMLGVTRQTLNKALGELRAQGQVKKVGNQYWVRNSESSHGSH
ncbi:MAG: Crp/Fnr family transcriptional regulator [Pseudomonadota bacterium]|nr:Crp/Fnr family transcriptional regulator [Pseudomonadota bacterium]